MGRTSHVKLEHYVPKLYLRNFTIAGKQDHIYCFDKLTSKNFMVNIKNIASETYFYDTSEADYRAENLIQQFESHLKPVYDKLILTQDLDSLEPSEKRLIAVFVALQAMRTKQYRMMIKHYMETIFDYFTDYIKLETKLSEELRNELIKPRTEEGLKGLHVKSLDQLGRAVDSLFQKVLILIINDTDIPYWSSDHPVFPPLYTTWHSALLEIPLSPKVSLWFCDSSIKVPLRTKYLVSNVDTVIDQNRRQVMSARQYIFSDNADFSNAEMMIQRVPELRDTERVRQYNLLFRQIPFSTHYEFDSDSGQKPY